MHPAREEVAALIERSGKNIKEAKAIVRRLRMVQSRNRPPLASEKVSGPG
jgi:hypothetical protein